jgi:hypothetical protein
MTYQGIEFTSPALDAHSWDHARLRKAAYNLFAVFALLAAAAFIASAYHPGGGDVTNPRYDSLGHKQAPAQFKGTPPLN